MLNKKIYYNLYREPVMRVILVPPITSPFLFPNKIRLLFPAGGVIYGPLDYKSITCIQFLCLLHV